jgi:hypothetical protein
VKITIDYYVRASGPRGGCFRWRCTSLAAARKLARSYRRKWNRKTTLRAWLSAGRAWSAWLDVRDEDTASCIRQRAIDDRRSDLLRDIANARRDIEYHQRSVHGMTMWRIRPEVEISYHERRIAYLEERIATFERWLGDLP